MYVRRSYSSRRRPVSSWRGRAQGGRFYPQRRSYQRYSSPILPIYNSSRDGLLRALRARGQVAPPIYPVVSDPQHNWRRDQPAPTFSGGVGHSTESNPDANRGGRGAVCVGCPVHGVPARVLDDTKVLGTGGQDSDSKYGSRSEEKRALLQESKRDLSLRSDDSNRGSGDDSDQRSMDHLHRVGRGERTDIQRDMSTMVHGSVDAAAASTLATMDSLSLSVMPGGSIDPGLL